MTKEFEGKKLLVLGGFTLACDIVRHAQAMGAYVVVADYNPNVPAKDVADKFVLTSATDVDALVDVTALWCDTTSRNNFTSLIKIK